MVSTKRQKNWTSKTSQHWSVLSDSRDKKTHVLRNVKSHLIILIYCWGRSIAEGGSNKLAAGLWWDKVANGNRWYWWVWFRSVNYSVGTNVWKSYRGNVWCVDYSGAFALELQPICFSAMILTVFTLFGRVPSGGLHYASASARHRFR